MKKLSILVINSNFYKNISKNLLKGVEEVLDDNESKYKIVNVPGALEIPVVLKKYKNDFDGFIILGCVIRGETSHYELVTNITAAEIYSISNYFELALGFALVTAENLEQAITRADPKKKNYGGKATITCLEMIKVLKKK